jgi:hypothetical protein
MLKVRYDMPRFWTSKFPFLENVTHKRARKISILIERNPNCKPPCEYITLEGFEMLKARYDMNNRLCYAHPFLDVQISFFRKCYAQARKITILIERNPNCKSPCEHITLEGFEMLKVRYDLTNRLCYAHPFLDVQISFFRKCYAQARKIHTSH